MSRFSECLKTVIEANALTLLDVEKLTGIDPATLSRLCTAQRVPSRSVLAALCTKLHPDVATRYELLTTHLIDEAEASGLDVSKLTIRHAPAGTDRFDLLPPGLQATLELLGDEAQRCTEFRHLLEDGRAFLCATMPKSPMPPPLSRICASSPKIRPPRPAPSIS